MRDGLNSNQHPQRIAAAGVLLVVATFAGCGAQAPPDDHSSADSAGQAHQASSVAEDGSAGSASEIGMRGNLGSDSRNAGTQASSVSLDEKKVGDSMLRKSYYECAEKTEGVTQAIQDCIEQEYEYQDGRLNRAYRKLMEDLPVIRRDALRDEQRGWLVERDKKCDWDAETEGQAQRLDANDCLLKMTAARADELEGMLQ